MQTQLNPIQSPQSEYYAQTIEDMRREFANPQPIFIPKEFKALVPPEYNPVTDNECQIVNVPKQCRLPQLGYFKTRSPHNPSDVALMEGQKTWMSLSALELESLGYQARLSSGWVVVMGLGLGALVYNLLQNKKVTRITVCEMNPRIISLLRKSCPWFDRAILLNKIELCVVDALGFRLAGGAKPDVLLVDIWPGLGSQDAEPDTRQIQANVQARLVGWWGQELDFVSWLYASPDPFRNFTGALTAYQDYLGFTIIGANHHCYPSLVMAAAKNVAMAIALAENRQCEDIPNASIEDVISQMPFQHQPSQPSQPGKPA